jgi:hypothetical protein
MHRLAVFTLLLAAAGVAQTLPRAVTDPGAVVTRQSITPAGVQSVFEGRVYGVRFGATPSEVWVLGVNELFHLEWRANRVIERVRLGGSPGLHAVGRKSGPPGNRLRCAIWPRASQ